MEHFGVTQNMEHRVADAFRLRHVYIVVIGNHFVGINNVAQYRKQMLVNALDDFTVDKGDGRSAGDLQLDAALDLEHTNFERAITLQQFLPSSMRLPQFSTASEQLRNSS